MKKAWIVFGDAGQYEDNEQWNVAAFTSSADAQRWRAAAQAYVAAFNEQAAAWNEKHGEDEDWPPMRRPEPRRHLDKGLTYARAYDASYGVVFVPLNPTAPTRKEKR